MNELFVNVKVDREERPDVDAIYMEAVPGHDRARRLADDRVPHARRVGRSTAAPTSPSVGRQGMPSFTDAVSAPSTTPREQPSRRRREQADQPHRGPRPAAPSSAPGDGLPRPRSLAERRDAGSSTSTTLTWGGFGRRTQVPPGDEPRPPPARAAPARVSADRLEPMVTTSLDAMASGGIYDHLGRRLRPLLGRRPVARPPLREDALRPGAARPRLPARLAGHRPGRPTARCSTRRSPTSCATCATTAVASTRREDADSRGRVEGKFYVWSPDEIRRASSARRAPRRRSTGRASRRPATSRADILHRPVRGDLLRPADDRGGPPGALRAPRAAGSGPASTTRS